MVGNSTQPHNNGNPVSNLAVILPLAAPLQMLAEKYLACSSPCPRDLFALVTCGWRRRWVQRFLLSHLSKFPNFLAHDPNFMWRHLRALTHMKIQVSEPAEHGLVAPHAPKNRQLLNHEINSAQK